MFLLLVLVVTFVCGAEVSEYFLTASNISIALAGVMPVAIVALADDADHHHRRDRHLGRLDRRALRVVHGGLHGAGPADRSGDARRRPRRDARRRSSTALFVVYAGLPSLVVTIGTLALYRGIAQIILKERGVTAFPNGTSNRLRHDRRARRSRGAAIIFVLLFVGFAVYLHATRWGRALYAIGNNREAARFSGIDVDRAMLGVFVTSGAMCAIAAVVLTAYLASARSDTAIGLELPVITAVVLGGVNIFGGSGTLVGVLIALLVLAFVQNALGLAGVTPEEQQIVTGAVLILTLMVFGASGWVRDRAAALRRLRAQPSYGDAKARR